MRKRRAILGSLQADAEEPLINLTPLIDVVFVVLIIFILIAPMMEIDRVQLASSGEKSEHTSAESSSPIAIYVRKDNTIWMHGKQIPYNQLLSIFREKKKQHPTQIPQLYHDRWAHFGTYQKVKDALESAGFTELDVILEPDVK